jgi:Urea amidohydrolase (urease) alpha subunit
MENKMGELDTIIENGLVVTEECYPKMNVGIKDQKIAYIGQECLEAKTKVNAEKLICASTVELTLMVM